MPPKPIFVFDVVVVDVVPVSPKALVAPVVAKEAAPNVNPVPNDGVGLATPKPGAADV